jgi:peptidoglycan/LPS O-acetylase OafA/YrhL
MRPDLEMMRLLFLPDAIRTTTVVMGLLLLGFGLIRRRPLQGFLAAMAWIVAYEAAWQLTAYLVDGRPLGWPIVPAAVAALAISALAPTHRRTLAGLDLDRLPLEHALGCAL